VVEGQVVVTGASGFVGRELVSCLTGRGHAVRPVYRRAPPARLSNAVVLGDIGPDTDWQSALAGAGCIVHLAARVHVMDDRAADPLASFRRVNRDGTLRLAREAVAQGVRRFVYVSSIKVNGETTQPGVPFTAEDEPAPMDPYGISKHEAEQALRRLAEETGMEVVIVRPPLVYGPGVKANFLSLMRWLHRGVPLPLGAIDNRRSLLALDNLVDLLVACIDRPAAANQVFLAADGEDLSTTDLLRRLGIALGRPARLLPVPAWMLQHGAALLGKGAVVQRLCDSLQVDIGKTRRLLGWEPPVTVDEALRKTAQDYLESVAR
jgi:nucleoside-diphosphate-sugar epimerase